MENNKFEEIKKEINQLLKMIGTIKQIYVLQNYASFELNSSKLKDSIEVAKQENLSKKYNEFYTKAWRIVKLFIPERLENFENIYINKKRKGDFSISSYDISLGLRGIYKSIDSGVYRRETYSLFEQQEAILNSALCILDSKLFDIQGEIQYDIFMHELDAANHLLKNKFVRAAGATAGVALESHLKSVCQNHGIKISKKDTICSYNLNLKNQNVITQLQWRKIEFLAEVRNLCDHKKDEEPTEAQVQDLINGTKQIISEIM